MSGQKLAFPTMKFPPLGSKPVATSTPQPTATQAQEDTTGIFTMPSYDFASQIPVPNRVGVYPGDSLDSVFSAMKGVAYYGDVIGFGDSSSSFTQGMPFQRYGTNFFAKTGMQCSNGADMWTYFKGIPDGTAFGTNLKRALQGSMGGNFQLSGLAPGMIEDSKEALNLKPIVDAIKGDVFYECEQVTLPVGDDRGLIQDPNPEPGKPADKWIIGNDVVYNKKTGKPEQTRWVKKKLLTQEQYEAAPKTHNPDGTLKKKEAFENPVDKASVAVAIFLLCTAVVLCRND